MSLLQKTYVDYRNLGDKGQDNSSSIQPVVDGEPASMLTFARPSENLRSRTEIARDVFDDLIYYRDRTYRYLIEVTAGALTWEIGGVGRVNNTGNLILRPFITPRTNLKGSLVTGTVAVNQLTYTVAAGAYASDGMNAITVEHRSVALTVTPVVTITAGPIYRILVVYDATNVGHTAGVVSGLINTAIAGVPALTGKLSTSASGAVSAIATLVETPIDIRTHTGGITGIATADVEAHTLASGALATFTTTNPLAEGDLLAIRYDYIVEPTGTADDPKGGVPGGRAESNQSRANSDVSTNLFIAQTNPEWLPGCIPLCKVVNGNLHWIDGTVLATGTSGAPGTSLGVFVNSAVFSGLPTIIVNGGIDNAGSIDTVQEALVSIDQRLSQHRFATYVITDGTASTGGAFNAATAFTDGLSAVNGQGGKLVVRRGTYTTGFIAGSANTITCEGETSVRGVSAPLLVTQTTTVATGAAMHIRNMSFTRTSNNRATIDRDALLENVTWASGTLSLGAAGAYVEMRNCQMDAANIAAESVGGLALNGGTVFASNCRFNGTDVSSSAIPVVFQGSNVTQAVYNGCSFIDTVHNNAPAFAFADTGNANGTLFNDCYFRTIGGAAFIIDIQTTYTGGDITFVGCTFDNTGSIPVIRTRHAGGRVRFVNCTFRCAGAPGGLGTAFMNMLAIAPALAVNAFALASTTFENCHAFVNCTNFTSMTRAIVELGSADTAAAGSSLSPVFGHVRVKGFTLSFSGATTVLPPTTCLLLAGRNPLISAGNPNSGAHVFEDIAVVANGKSTPTTQANINGQTPYIIQLLNTNNSFVRPTASDLRITGLVAPQTDNISGGQIYAFNYDIVRYQSTVDQSTSTNRYSVPQVLISDGTLSKANIEFLNWSAAGAIQIVTTQSTWQARWLDSRFYTGLQSAGTTSPAIWSNGGEIRGIQNQHGGTQIAATATYIVRVIDAGTFAPAVLDCNLTSTEAVGAITGTSGVRVRVSGNRLNTGATTGAFINLTGATTGLVIIGNTLMTNGATAAACVPALNVAVDTAALVTLGNTFAVATASPN